MVNLRTMKNELSPLLRFDYIELVYVYGSFKSGDYKDVDVLVVVEDGLKKEKLLLVNAAIQKIKRDSKIDFHFQGVKSLGAWWRAIIDGEPWILTSLKSSIVLFDKLSVMEHMKDLIEKEKTYNRENRIDALIESSNNYDVEIREILLKSISDLSSIATEVAQIYLLKRNIVAVNKRKILKYLEKFVDYYDVYNDIIDLESKVNRGFLTEFTSENLEHYLEKIKLFVKKLECRFS